MNNRKKILDCALELFSSKGYDGVGVQEIALASGITKPTLYHYFGNKIGLFEALLKDKLTDFLNELEHKAYYQGDLPLTLFRVGKTYFSFAKKEKPFMPVYLSMSLVPINNEVYKVFLHFYEQEYNLIDNIFVKAVSNHGNMKGRNRVYTYTFIGMLNTYISLSLKDSIELDDECVYKAVHQYMHGIYS